MATIKQEPSADVEARLRDRRPEVWLSKSEVAEISSIVLGPWTQERSDRLRELGAGLCAFALHGAVPGEESARDVLRALGSAASARRTAALREHARSLRLLPHELEQRLREVRS